MNITKDLQLTSVRFHLKGHTLEETSELFEVPIELLCEWRERYMKGDYFIEPVLKKNTKKTELDFKSLKALVKNNPKLQKKDICIMYNRSAQYINDILKNHDTSWMKFKRDILREIDEEDGS